MWPRSLNATYCCKRMPVLRFTRFAISRANSLRGLVSKNRVSLTVSICCTTGPSVCVHVPCDCCAALTVSVRITQVEGQNEQLLARAPLVCYAVIYPTGERRMACEVCQRFNH
jgi:hypothetical protein